MGIWKFYVSYAPIASLRKLGMGAAYPPERTVRYGRAQIAQLGVNNFLIFVRVYKYCLQDSIEISISFVLS